MAGKLALLEPWSEPLRGRLALEQLGERTWVLVRPPPSFMAILNREASDVRLLREALELLSLVAVVDNEAWRLVLRQWGGLELEDAAALDGARFLLRFDAEHVRYSASLPAATLRQLFLPRPPLHCSRAAHDGARSSAGYQDALLAILAAHRAAGGRQEAVNRWRTIPYALQFVDLWNVGQPVLATHLSSLLVALDEVRKHNEWLTGARGAEHRPLLLDEQGNETHGPLTRCEDDGSADGHYFAYELEFVHMCFGTISVSRNLHTVLLAALGMPRVVLSELQFALKQENYFLLGEVHPRTLAAYHRSGMLFNTMFGGRSITARPNSQPQTIRRSAIESVVMPVFDMDDQAFSGLCASLAEASGVRKLALGNAFRHAPPDQRTRRWQWLAYALFSEASCSSIEDVDLTGIQLSNADVDAIAEVLAAKVPEPGQATDAAEAAYAEGGRTVEYVFVPKGTVVRIKKSIASRNEITTMKTVDDFIFRLLQSDSEGEWVNVLVPGRGNGVIASELVCRPSDDDAKALLLPSRATGGITSFSFLISGSVEQEMSVLLRFLQLVGRSLQKLSIGAVRSMALDVRGILQACPKLEQLFLNSVQIDLDALVVEVENGNATPRCLALECCKSPADVITRFAKKLGDPNSALANGMRELCLNVDNEEFPMTEEIVKTFLDVLKTNHKLIHLELLVLPPLFDKYSAAFHAHHQEPLCVEKEKLPLRCRLAFLSVIRGHSTPANDTFLHVDNHLLHHIFTFAAVSAKRSICLRCDH
ncbi:unnamed protein product [Phytophthora fragariaefolia]|uniref:Unnamed protein product n=1 Tax=Phytophthora fragariaefolia TaxID=1490495 RepID=A0A9W6TWC8_9STRA|nr:unnamed protein product [Phytophthora fragariaefolia]